MPLNKLENFIKNTEGRILYVNPNDLDATDAIENQGNSLTKPFKTIQRALLESARFSYLAGNNNDLVEKTTILLFPGEHIVDNRPGFAIRNDSGVAVAIDRSGDVAGNAQTVLTLTSTSNFDLTQENNILYKFNSIDGGVVVPRGTSIVGLDLRKTKIRPKYVPNPTDGAVRSSAIFKVTGACYFWQFSIFDGDENTTVYTDPTDFSVNNRSKPTFSHHKLTGFEYVDGVTKLQAYSNLTDLDIYYAKLSNAFNIASNRDIDNKWPDSPGGFAAQLPEYQIVGAFATDPIAITDVISGDGSTPSTQITVTTSDAHELSVGTPISISGVNVSNYNVSTKVTSIISDTQFTYSLPFIPPTLTANPGLSNAKITVETDTVSGASPYIFNVSMRSVWGMNGMHADGAKASGFRSMVVAQYTAVSLQKDDRAFVKYNPSSRSYDGLTVTKVTGASLSSGSSSTVAGTVYHLDPEATYRTGWESSHVKASNDSIIQIVSVFAIGFTKHFEVRSGGDFSVTNSNSNFGQLSLIADGFKKEAFDRDNKAFITSIITPKSITPVTEEVEWVGIDTSKTNSVGISSHLYLLGFEDAENRPSSLVQGYKVGAKVDDKIFIRTTIAGVSSVFSSSVYMTDNVIVGTAQTATGTTSSFKSYDVVNITGANVDTINLSATHTLNTGEKVIVIEDDGDLPENLDAHQVYYVIDTGATTIKLASSRTNAENQVAIKNLYYGGSKLHIISRVSDKESGDIGSPVQFDEVEGQWFIHTDANSNIYQNVINGTITSDDIFYIERTEDSRGLDEKLYKFRLVIPKEFEDTKDPEEGFILQETSTTGLSTSTDFTLATLVDYPSAAAPNPYQFARNPRFISTCSVSGPGNSIVTIRSELPHNLNVEDIIIVKNVTSTTNTVGAANSGYNGTFAVTAVDDDKTFQYSTTDVDGIQHSAGAFTNDTSNRDTNLPRFERNDWKGNYYIYRSEVIVPHEQGVQDGVYHLYVISSDYASPAEFTDTFFSQNVNDLYPQMDRDNADDNPQSSKSFAKRGTIGDVVTNDLKKSITRETVDKVLSDFFVGLPIDSVTNSTGVSTITFSREHNLSGIVTYSNLAGGSGYTNGTYYNVKLFNEIGLTNWDGATAKVVVASGIVTSVDIIAGGSGYSGGETLYFDTSVIGSGSNATIGLSTAGISTVIGNTVQITGIGTTAGGHFRVTGVPADNQIAIAKTAGDPLPISGQYLINIGPQILINETNNTTGFTTFTTFGPHGLIVGNRINILDNLNNNLGNYIVSPIGLGVTTFGVTSNVSAANPTYVLKHGIDSNDRASDAGGENLGSRGLSFYANETLILQENITTDTQFKVLVPNSGISTENRFPLGSYLQVGDEIMKINVSGLTGTNNDEIQVIRGSLGTLTQNHPSGSLIKKIDVRSVEYRRPSLIRASGHTFEYLGFGPGNYSTGLPQVQVRTLTEKEEFLAQSQQRSGGIVVYTGMNNRGDFYIGNKRVSSATGKEKVFGIPVPTITGVEASDLSVIYDEVTVKQRIFVEGGNNKNILSQFNGPVNFTKNVKLKGDITSVTGKLKIETTTGTALELISTEQSNTKSGGAFVVAGGVGVGKNINAGGNITAQGNITADGNAKVGILTVSSNQDSSSKDTGALVVKGGVGIEKKLYVGGDTESTSKNTGSIITDGGIGVEKNLYVGGNITADGNAKVGILTVSSNQDSSSKDTGALVVEGGAGIEKNLYVGGNVNVLGIATITDELTVSTGIVPDANEDAYVGTSALPFSEAHIGKIRIANGVNNNTIDTASGDLILDSANGLVDINDNLDVSGTAGVGSTLTVNSTAQSTSKTTGAIITQGGIGVEKNIFAGGYVSANGALLGNATTGLYSDGTNLTVRMPAASPGGQFLVQNNGGTLSFATFDNTQITLYRKLIINSASSGSSGYTIIQSPEPFAKTNTLTLPKAGSNINAVIARTTQEDGTITLGTDTNGNYVASISGGDGLTGSGTGEGSTPTLAVGAGTGITVNADNVQIKNAGSLSNNTILKWTTSGNQLTDSNITDNGTTITLGGENTNVSGNVTITGNSTLVGQVKVNTGIVPDADEGAYIGVSTLPFSEAYIGELQLAVGTTVDSDNTITTTSGNLILDSYGGTVDIKDNLGVSGTAVVGSTLTVNSETQSTSKDTGAIITQGGIGVEKNIFAGGYVSATTPSGNITTGGIVIQAKASGSPGGAILQFTSYDGNTEFCNLRATSDDILRLSDKFEVNTSGVTLEEALAIRKGGNLALYASNDSSKATLYCDVDTELGTDGRILVTTPNGETTGGLRIKANSSGDSYLQFLQNNGTSETVYIKADNTNKLYISKPLEVNTVAGVTTAALSVRNGGDLLLYANNNSDLTNLYCDASYQLATDGSFSAKTPSGDGTTGGLIIRAKESGSTAGSFVQFTNSAGNSQLGFIQADSTGLTISPSLKVSQYKDDAGTIYGAVRCWGKMKDGTGNPGVDEGDGVNVNSVTRIGNTGDENIEYTVNFVNPLPNNKYAVLLTIASGSDHVLQVTSRGQGFFKFRATDPGQGNNQATLTASVMFTVIQ